MSAGAGAEVGGRRSQLLRDDEGLEGIYFQPKIATGRKCPPATAAAGRRGLVDSSQARSSCRCLQQILSEEKASRWC